MLPDELIDLIFSYFDLNERASILSTIGGITWDRFLNYLRNLELVIEEKDVLFLEDKVYKVDCAIYDLDKQEILPPAHFGLITIYQGNKSAEETFDNIKQRQRSTKYDVNAILTSDNILKIEGREYTYPFKIKSWTIFKLNNYFMYIAIITDENNLYLYEPTGDKTLLDFDVEMASIVGNLTSPTIVYLKNGKLNLHMGSGLKIPSLIKSNIIRIERDVMITDKAEFIKFDKITEDMRYGTKAHRMRYPYLYPMRRYDDY